MELLRDPAAFALLTLIALRARRDNSLSVLGLRSGQSLIGDYEAAGLSKQSYRSAKSRLKKYGLATFNPTPRGTIASLTDTSVFDVNATPTNTQTNTQPTHSQHTANTQPTPNKKERIKECKEGEAPPPSQNHLYPGEKLRLLEELRNQLERLRNKYGRDVNRRIILPPERQGEADRLAARIKQLEGEL
jgi:hypothetical protein